MQIEFTAIVAMCPGRIIGLKGRLPWHIPQDLKIFSRVTTGHPVIMGTKTWNSLSGPLPDRQNIILSRKKNWKPRGAEVIHHPDDLLDLELMDSEVFIIGGAEIYELFLPQTSKLLISYIYQAYRGDSLFPDFKKHFSDYSVLEKHPLFELRLYKR